MRRVTSHLLAIVAMKLSLAWSPATRKCTCLHRRNQMGQEGI